MKKTGVITKTVLQYSTNLPDETIGELKKIALDYNKVRNYVYSRYSGINSLNKLIPGYTVLNEMRYCGLRQQLNLPVVYYELAIFDALRDIKSMWSNLKNRIAALVKQNENLTQDDRIYLFTVLNYPSVFNAIVLRKEYEMPKNTVGLQLDVKRLNNLLCRYVRKYKQISKVDKKCVFAVSPNGYKYYGKGLIGFVGRIPRKRIMVELKDNDVHTRQLRVFVEEEHIKIYAPVDVEVKQHTDYINTVYLHIGFGNMLTSSDGNVYGKDFNKLVNTETDRLRIKNIERYKSYKAYSAAVENNSKAKSSRIKANNLGKKKYFLQKKNKYAKMTTFINSEINRMLKEEKPCAIVIAKAVAPKKAANTMSKYSREKLNRSFGGYIRKRLTQKCAENGVAIIEVSPKDISSICSSCGKSGKKQNSFFICGSCGTKTDKYINAALNIKNKYLSKENI